MFLLSVKHVNGVDVIQNYIDKICVVHVLGGIVVR
jgi:hypothetical protein